MSTPAHKVPVTILVPVKNETANLPRCLASVAWAGAVIVIDSHSTDGTPELARRLGAQVVQFDFNGTWPKKREWALRNLPFAHEWVFFLDADEVLPPETEAEVRAIVENPKTTHAGYWINRRFMFLGQWLRHAYFPNWNLRLFRHKSAHYEKLAAEADTRSGDNEIHEHVIVAGTTGRLECLMDHYAFPTIEAFVEKHNRYSNWEAAVALEERPNGRSAENLQHGNVTWRRRLKNLSRKLPFRPLQRFLYVYVWQLGFLDGRAGWYFARLHAFYEFLNVAKTYELRRARVTTVMHSVSMKDNGEI